MVSSLVWITGASRGIGLALASSVPWPNAHVVGVSRTSPDRIVTDEYITADLATQWGWDSLAQSIAGAIASAAELERVVLVHAAATVHPIGFAGETDPASYQAAVLLNTVAPQVIGRAFLDATRELDCPRALVLLTTGTSTGTYPGWSAYKAGKAAVDAWVQAEATNAEARLTVLAVAPGVVDTAMQERIRATDRRDFPRRDKFVKLHEGGELATPSAVASRIWTLLDSPPGERPVIDLRDEST